MKEKIVIIGAGSAMFVRGLVADCIRSKEEMELSLVDIDPDVLKVVEGLARKMIAVRQAPIKLNASTDRRQVLSGATSVICTIGVGGRRAWEQDVFIPRKYGIYQPVGDSVMPGGTSRALRMIPAMVAIAEDVLDLAPDALFFNYGNPLPVVCRAVRKATGANMVGLCHGVFYIGDYLAHILEVKPSEMEYTAVGVNHLTWFIKVRIKSEDGLPALQRIAARELSLLNETAELGKMFFEAGNSERIPPHDIHPFTWQLTQLFNAFPAVLDRHVTEFFPHLFARKNSYYGRTLGVDAYNFEDCIAYGDSIYSQMCADAFSQKPLSADYFEKISGEHEQVMEIIRSIRHDTGEIYSANLPNKGQVPNLPEDAIVESPAVAGKDGLKPIKQAPLPSGLVGTLASRFPWVETIIEAALTGSSNKFIQALLLDGAVDSPETAAQLAGDLLEAQAEFLPQFSRKSKNNLHRESKK